MYVELEIVHTAETCRHIQGGAGIAQPCKGASGPYSAAHLENEVPSPHTQGFDFSTTAYIDPPIHMGMPACSTSLLNGWVVEVAAYFDATEVGVAKAAVVPPLLA